MAITISELCDVQLKSLSGSPAKAHQESAKEVFRELAGVDNFSASNFARMVDF